MIKIMLLDQHNLLVSGDYVWTVPAGVTPEHFIAGLRLDFRLQQGHRFAIFKEIAE